MAGDALTASTDKKSVTSDANSTHATQADSTAKSSPSNIFSEYLVSAYQGGIGRPLIP
jgi:hypothetical protein